MLYAKIQSLHIVSTDSFELDHSMDSLLGEVVKQSMLHVAMAFLLSACIVVLIVRTKNQVASIPVRERA